MSPVEIALWLAPTAVFGLILLIYLATNRIDTDEYRRLVERVRHLEAHHVADLAQINSAREEIFYLSRLVSVLADLIQQAGLPLPADVRKYLQKRQGWQPAPLDPDLAVLVQHTLNQFFNLEELSQLAFEIGVDLEILPGSTRESKARELVLFVDRRGQLEMLVDKIAQMRPNVPLPWRGGRDPP